MCKNDHIVSIQLIFTDGFRSPVFGKEFGSNDEVQHILSVLGPIEGIGIAFKDYEIIGRNFNYYKHTKGIGLFYYTGV